MNWTQEELHQLIQEGISITKFLKSKNLSINLYRKVKQDLNSLGYGNVNMHKNAKRSKRVHWSEEAIKKAVASSYGYVDCIRTLTGRTTKNGGDINRLKQYIEKYNIDCSHFPPTHVRTSLGTKKFKTTNSINDIFCKDTKFSSNTIHDRFMSLSYPEMCSICSIKEWCEAPIVLQLDHINGDKKDCRQENLRWVCPNCHSQTPTYARGLKQKINWPSDAELLTMYTTKNCYEIGKLLNISPAYVSKKIRSIKTNQKPLDY